MTKRHRPAEPLFAQAVPAIATSILVFTPGRLTVGELKRQLDLLDVGDDVVVKTINGDNWRLLEHMSFCRSKGEVVLW
jgi:hypothetical protein